MSLYAAAQRAAESRLGLHGGGGDRRLAALAKARARRSILCSERRALKVVDRVLEQVDEHNRLGSTPSQLRTSPRSCRLSGAPAAKAEEAIDDGCYQRQFAHVLVRMRVGSVRHQMAHWPPQHDRRVIFLGQPRPLAKNQEHGRACGASGAGGSDQSDRPGH